MACSERFLFVIPRDRADGVSRVQEVPEAGRMRGIERQGNRETAISIGIQTGARARPLCPCGSPCVPPPDFLLVADAQIFLGQRGGLDPRGGQGDAAAVQRELLGVAATEAEASGHGALEAGEPRRFAQKAQCDECVQDAEKVLEENGRKSRVVFCTPNSAFRFTKTKVSNNLTNTEGRVFRSGTVNGNR